MMLSSRTAHTKREMLRGFIESEAILLMPGVGDPLSAMLAERTGFKAVFSSGAVIANVGFGRPDIGLLTMTEVVERTYAICEAVELPVFADADTGYGGPLNVIRAVEKFESAGVAGLMLEDQVSPKRCGHFEGKQIIPMSDMIEKIVAFRKARTDPALVLIARTDAIAVEGFDEALRRGRAYAAAGADVVFVEAPQSREQQEAIPADIPAPTMANMVEGGKTPLRTAAELEQIGYGVVVFPSSVMRAAAFAARRALAVLLATGTSAGASDWMLDWEERQGLVRLPEHQRLEDSIRTEAVSIVDQLSRTGSSGPPFVEGRTEEAEA